MMMMMKWMKFIKLEEEEIFQIIGAIKETKKVNEEIFKAILLLTIKQAEILLSMMSI